MAEPITAAELQFLKKKGLVKTNELAQRLISEVERLRREVEYYKGDIASLAEQREKLRALNGELVEACKSSLSKFEEYYASRTGAMPTAMRLCQAAIAKASAGNPSQYQQDFIDGTLDRQQDNA